MWSRVRTWVVRPCQRASQRQAERRDIARPEACHAAWKVAAVAASRSRSRSWMVRSEQ
jgi:hypothetical protein